MKNIEKKTVNEWFDAIGARRDWCYKPERKVRSHPSIEFIDDVESSDAFDKNRAAFIRELDSLMS